MKKSPFSTPCGNGAHKESKWKSNKRHSERGYFPLINSSFNSNCSPNTSFNSSANDDFIAFNTSTPSNREVTPNKSFVGLRGGRNRNFHYSPGYRIDNHSPKAYSNNYSSPYRNDWRQSYKNNKMFPQKRPRREIHISQYVNLTSFLEDPWKNLMDEHNKATIAEKNLNTISINSNTDVIHLDNYTDDNALMNTSNCSQETQNQSINDEICFNSVDKLESNTPNQDCITN